MKKTKLRKTSKRELAVLEKKLDREYQDFFRELCWENNIRSEYSGKKMEVSHHYREKSRSANLRYKIINFIPLTTGEHSEHHLSKGDGKIMNRVIAKRGQEWVKEIEKLSQVSILKDKKYYEEAEKQLELLKANKEPLVNNYKKLGYFYETL
jgi:FtsZ-interacting cell division protein YlmF